MLSFNVGCVPVLMWFLLEGSDPVSAIMESVAVMAVDELEDQGRLTSLVFRCSAPSFFHIASPSLGILLDSFPDPSCFLSDRSFNLERER